MQSKLFTAHRCKCHKVKCRRKHKRYDSNAIQHACKEQILTIKGKKKLKTNDGTANGWYFQFTYISWHTIVMIYFSFFKSIISLCFFLLWHHSPLKRILCVCSQFFLFFCCSLNTIASFIWTTFRIHCWLKLIVYVDIYRNGVILFSTHPNCI